jgi:hypothetical protein
MADANIHTQTKRESIMHTYLSSSLFLVLIFSSAACADHDLAALEDAEMTVENDLTARAAESAMQRAYKSMHQVDERYIRRLAATEQSEIPLAARKALDKFTKNVEVENDTLVVFVDHYAIVYSTTKKKTIAGYAAVAYGSGDDFQSTTILGVTANGAKIFSLDERE